MKKHEPIPRDFAVRPLTARTRAKAKTVATCGHCGLSWDDDEITSMTPAPAGRCPFKGFHLHKSPRVWKSVSNFGTPNPQFVWIVWAYDIWYTMNGGIVPTLVSVHRSKEGAVAMQKSLNAKRNRNGVTYKTTPERITA